MLLNHPSYPTKLKFSENKAIITPFPFTQKPPTDSEVSKPFVIMKKVRMNRSSSTGSKLALSQILKPTHHKEAKLFEVVDLKSSYRDKANAAFNIDEYLEEKINSSNIKEKPHQTSSSSNPTKAITLNFLNTRNKLRESINSKTLREKCEPYFFGDFRQTPPLKLSQRTVPSATEPNEIVSTRAIVAQKAIKIFQNPEISRRIMQEYSKETIENSIEDLEVDSESSHLTDYIPTERDLLYGNSAEKTEPVKSKPKKNSEILQGRKSFMGLYVVGQKVDKNKSAFKNNQIKNRRAKTESSFLLKEKTFCANTESSREEENKAIVEQLFKPMGKSQVIPRISKSSQPSLQRTIYPFMVQKESFPGVRITKTFYVSDLVGYTKHKRSQSTRIS